MVHLLFVLIMIGDFENHKIRKITKNGTVETIAGTTLGYEGGNISVQNFIIHMEFVIMIGI